MLGAKSKYAPECFEGDFIGADWLADMDLTKYLVEDWKEFNQTLIPVYLEANPEKSKVAAGLACGMLHTICRGSRPGDIVVCPDGQRNYRFGEISSEYIFAQGQSLTHQRKVHWFSVEVPRAAMSEELQNSAGSGGTVSDITRYADELESFLSGEVRPILTSPDKTIEDPSALALEKHLEDFLVQNWSQTELGQRYDIFEDEVVIIGQQYPTDTGPIDILALEKGGKEILVIELKKGRASDSVVGQIQRYMGYIMSEVAEPDQVVKGCIIALEDDQRIRYALEVNPAIEFYRYQITFKLLKQ